MNKITKSGCAGAILIHPVALALLIAWGVVFGVRGPDFNATSSGSTVESGVAGASNAIQLFLAYYILTLGVVPVIVSIAGFVTAALGTKLLARGK